ncbi:MAG TPA: hypothetical protein VFQ12_09770 [Thermoleophilaceae bacterium]|nr:hypothetical protein [Thermoleophilaceae bacterium]
MARRSLKPQLNQIRTWVRQGRTDAWIAHQLDVSVGDIRSFKRDHDLAPADSGDVESDATAVIDLDEPDLRAEDDALVAAALEAEAEATEDEPDQEPEDDSDDDDENGDKPRKRRRGRRGGRGRRRRTGALEGTFDHGDEGYGLWLDPAVQDDPVYAEHWAGHRTITIVVEPERIVITRSGEEDGSEA